MFVLPWSLSQSAQDVEVVEGGDAFPLRKVPLIVWDG